MKILFVEDNAGFAGDLERVLLEIPNINEIVPVRDKESAIAKLKEDLIDLIVLDLSIPPNPDTEVADPEHGQAVFHEARALHPGTPIFVLTGSEVDKFSRGLARFGNQVRLWGEQTPMETVSYFLKEEVDELIARITTMASSFAKMSAVAINTRGKDLGLSPVQVRMLKSYANSVDCVACDVSLLSGGLSDTKVVKATAVDQSRKPQALCAAKLGERSIIASEKDAYEKHVRKLAIGACPVLFSVIDDGVGLNGAIFYTLTDNDTLSLFERLAADPTMGAKVVAHVRGALTRWSEASTADMVTIGEVRSRMIDDDDAAVVAQKFDINSLRAVETLRVQASISCIHGDLHCGNVLVKSSGEAVVIDFGDAGQGFTALDPIALELSLVFHPDAKKLGLRDSLIGNLDAWPDVDRFTADCKLKPTISACRDWAHDVGGGDLAVLAAAYAYAFRQLKYETAPPNVTVRFLMKLAERIRAG
jgi:DNA-binding NarL/FixJ family response regulator